MGRVNLEVLIKTCHQCFFHYSEICQFCSWSITQAHEIVNCCFFVYELKLFFGHVIPCLLCSQSQLSIICSIFFKEATQAHSFQGITHLPCNNSPLTTPENVLTIMTSLLRQDWLINIQLCKMAFCLKE